MSEATTEHRLLQLPVNGINRLDVAAYTIPTDAAEADGTYQWNKTTIVVVEAHAGSTVGLGYTYADRSTAQLIADTLAPLIEGRDPLDVAAAWLAMVHAIRNLGRPGVCSMAISAVDTALWDLKARLLQLPLVKLLGSVRERIAVYASGGFPSYSPEQLQRQMAGWRDQGFRRVKMKIGADISENTARIALAREKLGPDIELFIDANGALSRKRALEMAEQARNYGVTWFEEPVSSDDLEGLRLLRDRAPPGMDIAAGEYGYDLAYFRRMLVAGAVDHLQADVTRCAGITGVLQVAALCDAFQLPLSAHCAPSLHLHVCCATPAMSHVEYFHDHGRIEAMLLDGAATPVDGMIEPDASQPGMGLRLKREHAEQYLVWSN